MKLFASIIAAGLIYTVLIISGCCHHKASTVTKAALTNSVPTQVWTNTRAVVIPAGPIRSNDYLARLREACEIGDVCRARGEHVWEYPPYFQFSTSTNLLGYRRCVLCGSRQIKSAEWKDR